ncbi:MAG: pyruvate dehydrogenase complex dihydrolipoamide acetyltransferase [Vicinamibacteria bacterium]|nr:pyruvate dehydrogenase complex dihydrolipoamide acetyltransferase [Vicinamibacteria bacterium]
MITKVVLAKLSPTMEEGVIVKWTRKEGDVVKQGDVLAEIETDKANMEMEAMGNGTLRKILVPAGGKAPVGSLIGVIADAADDIAPLIASAAPAPAAAAPAPAPAAPVAAAAAPAAAPAAAAAAAAAATPAPAAAPVVAAPAPVIEGARVKASPLARAMAAGRNIPLGAVAGSGPGGRVIKRDIESYAAAPAAAAPPAAWPAPAGAQPASASSPAAPAVPAVTAGQELPLSQMRKTIAKRLSESAFSAPHFYVTVEVDMDRAVAMREQAGAAGVKFSYNDLVVKACARALAAFPTVNASWGGDKIVTHGEVHVGVAVAIPDGLITPVVRYADRKPLSTISAEIKDLATRAKDKKLKPEEYMGSTFTISNLGMYDVTEFTAIINPPDSAILAVGAVRKQPVVGADDQIRVGHRMKLTMSSDHRVIDGALAAQFLAEVRRLLETPVLALL